MEISLLMCLMDGVSISLIIVHLLWYSKHKGKKEAVAVYGICLLTALQGLLSALLFSEIPGDGFMPGFTYLAEFLISLGMASLASAVAVLFTIYLVIKMIRDKHKTKES